mgnify:CR=1 FL=1
MRSQRESRTTVGLVVLLLVGVISLSVNAYDALADGHTQNAFLKMTVAVLAVGFAAVLIMHQPKSHGH